MSIDFEYTRTGPDTIARLVSEGCRAPGVSYSQEEIDTIKEDINQVPFINPVIVAGMLSVQDIKDKVLEQCGNTEEVQNLIAYFTGLTSGQTVELLLRKEKFQFEETKETLCQMTAIYVRDKVLTEIFNRSRDVLQEESYENEVKKILDVLTAFALENKDRASNTKTVKKEVKMARQLLGLSKKSNKKRKSKKKNRKKRTKNETQMIMDLIKLNLKKDQQLVTLSKVELQNFHECQSHSFDIEALDKRMISIAIRIYSKVLKKFGNNTRVKVAFVHSLGEYGASILQKYYEQEPFEINTSLDQLIEFYHAYLTNTIEICFLEERIYSKPNEQYLSALLESLSDGVVEDEVLESMDDHINNPSKVSQQYLSDSQIESAEEELGKINELIEVADFFVKIGTDLFPKVVLKYGNTTEIRTLYANVVAARSAILTESYYEFLYEFSKYRKEDPIFPDAEHAATYMNFYVRTILLKESLKGWKKD